MVLNLGHCILFFRVIKLYKNLKNYKHNTNMSRF